MGEVTQLIAQARAGDADASRRLYDALYSDLRALARRQLAAHLDGGLGRTSLVHETYLKLARSESLAVIDRQHFLAVAARAMRQVAVDHARERMTAKRGGEAQQVSLDVADAVPTDGLRHDRMVALDHALQALERADPRLARLVELRFFAGMSLDEAGETVGLSARTLKRDFRKARAFLHHLLSEAELDGG